MYGVIAEIVLEGLKVFSAERKLKIEKDYHELLTKLDAARNDQSGNYTDAAIMIGEQELRNFLRAFAKELKEHNEKVIS